MAEWMGMPPTSDYAILPDRASGPHASRFTLHASRFTLNASRFTLHASRFTLHASRFTLHASRFTLHASRFTLHASRFTLPILHYSPCLIPSFAIAAASRHRPRDICISATRGLSGRRSNAPVFTAAN